MRILRVDPGVMDRLAPTVPASALRTLLATGGYLAEPAPGLPGAAEYAAVRAELEALDMAEQKLGELAHPHVWITGEIPPAVRWGMVGVAAILGIVGGAVNGLGTIFALVGTPLVLMPVALAGLVAVLLLERRRRQLFAEVDAARLRHGAALLRQAGTLAARTVVIEAGEVRLVSAPHLGWLVYRLRDLRTHRPPDAPPERDALAAALQAERERIEAAMSRREPTPAPTELQTDLVRWRAALTAWPTPPDRSGEGEWLTRALAT